MNTTSDPRTPSWAERARIKALAEQATPGPWTTDDMYRARVYCDDELGQLIADCRAPYAMQLPEPQKDANAAYIAACSPSVVLSLLAALDEGDARATAFGVDQEGSTARTEAQGG